jgi:hypothetical protein
MIITGRNGSNIREYMLCYTFYLVAIVLATILGLTEYVFVYKIVYFFKIAIIVFVTGSVPWYFKIKRLVCHTTFRELGELWNSY